MLLSASINATAVFLLVPVASASSVASWVFDNFFPFAISSNVLFLNLISMSVYTSSKLRVRREPALCWRRRIHRFKKVNPCFGRPLTEPAQTGDLLRREDYYTAKEVATEKCENQAFLLVEIVFLRNRRTIVTGE